MATPLIGITVLYFDIVSVETHPSHLVCACLYCIMLYVLCSLYKKGMLTDDMHAGVKEVKTYVDQVLYCTLL